MSKNRVEEIIRGDDQTISIPVSGFFDTTIGATAYLLVIPTTAPISDTIPDPNAIIKSTLGPLATNVTQLDFELSSSSAVPNSTLVPIATYRWYARVVEADSTVTTILLNPNTVKVVIPGDEVC